MVGAAVACQAGRVAQIIPSGIRRGWIAGAPHELVRVGIETRKTRTVPTTLPKARVQPAAQRPFRYYLRQLQSSTNLFLVADVPRRQLSLRLRLRLGLRQCGRIFPTHFEVELRACRQSAARCRTPGAGKCSMRNASTPRTWPAGPRLARCMAVRRICRGGTSIKRA